VQTRDMYAAVDAQVMQLAGQGEQVAIEEVKIGAVALGQVIKQT
jgi:hypothetical protein